MNLNQLSCQIEVKRMHVLITGVAGFVGVNLAKTLLGMGSRVCGVDNLSRGCIENMSDLLSDPMFSFKELDLCETDKLLQACKDFQATESITEVWHLAANSDILAGIEDASVDLRDTFMSTHSVIEVMKLLGIKYLAFSSSSAVYGDHGINALCEDTSSLLPISNYGAMKLASEAAISAAVESHFNQAWIFRFPNVVGVPATHGVIFDFVRKLQLNPGELRVLGDGSQKKSYLHVDELVEGMLFLRLHATEKRAIYNIGAADEGVTVKFIAEQTVDALGLTADIKFGEGNKGWVGDVPRFVYSTDKLKKVGWCPKLNSSQAVKKAITQVIEQESRK